MNIPETVAAQKEYFRSGATLPADFRRDRLRKLLDALYSWEKPLCDALMHDLHKSPEEAYMTEISMVRGEIRNQLAHLRSRMRRRLVPAAQSARRSDCGRVHGCAEDFAVGPGSLFRTAQYD